MKKSRIFKIGFALLSLLLLFTFGFTSCSSGSDDDEDPETTDSISTTTTTGGTTIATKGSYAVRSVTGVASSASVVLVWLAPSDTSNYGGVKISWNGNKVTLNQNMTTYTVTGLSASTSYTFTITTLDSSKNETSSSVTLKITTPAAQTSAGTTTYIDKTYASTVTFTATSDENGVVKVIMATATEGAAIYYTIDGTTPTAQSTEYTGAIEVTEDTAFRAVAVKDGIENSPVSVATVAIKKITDTDTDAPADVTGLKATNLDGAALLTWTDPADSDLFGLQITYTENTSSRSAMSAMEKGSIFVSPETQSAEITNLTNGTSYTFTVKAMDTSGNKSSGKSAILTPSVIQGNAMQVTLTPSTTEATNEDISVSVKITTDASSITSVKYASGEKDVSYFVSRGTTVSADDNEAYSFSASANGTYTVYAFDSDGRRETKTITIENIDKTSPKAVLELAADYDREEKKINLTWTTSDSDIDHYLVNYSVDGEAKATDESTSTASYSVESVEQGSGTYEFTVKAVDKAGNIGEASSASVTPVTAPAIGKITLDRYHIAYNASDMTVNVSVAGYNFDLIQNQSDTTFKIQLVSKDGTTVYDTEDADFDTSDNTATAVLTAPSSSSDNKKSGTEYTVRTILCGEVDTTHTATLTISSPASINSITLSTSKISVSDVTSGETTSVKISGWNFGAHSNITLQFYDSTNTAYGEPISIEKITSAEYSEVWQKGGVTIVTGSTTLDEINVDIEIPTVDDMYTLKVLFDGNANSETASLQVFGAPVFTYFRIPNAGISKAYSTVAAVVKGKNFTAPDITASSFTVTCSSKPYIASGAVVTVASDSRLTVSLNIPDVAGEYAVTVSCGSASYEGTFTVKDYSSYAAGQIVLADGSLVESSNYTKIDTSNPPVAVVAGITDYGTAIAVGMHTSYLSWTSENSTGYDTYFSETVCTPSDTGEGVADTATFTGDIDGSDNWEVICSVDPEGSADAAANYPAFNWVNNYGTTYSSYLGGVTEGWYMPSIAELCCVYRNRTTINTTLAVISKLNSSYAQNSLGTSDYYSSSQHVSNNRDVYDVYFGSGYLNSCVARYLNDDVLVVRAF